MSISAVSGTSESSPLSTDIDRQVAVLKKARNVEKALAEGLLELVKQVPAQSGRINTYA